MTSGTQRNLCGRLAFYGILFAVIVLVVAIIQIATYGVSWYGTPESTTDLYLTKALYLLIGLSFGFSTSRKMVRKS